MNTDEYCIEPAVMVLVFYDYDNQEIFFLVSMPKRGSKQVSTCCLFSISML